MDEIKKAFSSKYRIHFLIFLGVAVAIAGFYIYEKYQAKIAEQEGIMNDFEESIPLKCENGEWIEFPDLENSKTFEKFSGNARFKYDDKNDEFSNADNSQKFLTDENYSLLFFMDRDAYLEGWKIPNSNSIYVKKIRCVGEESDKNIQNQRRKLMDYISRNINSLALEKSQFGEWQVQSFYFHSNNDLYVEYEAVGSQEEDESETEIPYESRLWLIRVANPDRNVPAIETLAYIQENEEDPSKNILKVGQDIYRDEKNFTIYEYDEDQERWILQ